MTTRSQRAILNAGRATKYAARSYCPTCGHGYRGRFSIHTTTAGHRLAAAPRLSTRGNGRPGWMAALASSHEDYGTDTGGPAGWCPGDPTT